MSNFSPRPPGTVMHGEFHDFRQAVRALRVLKNAGYARAELKTGAEPQRDEPTVVVVDAAARGAARAAEILAEYGAQMHFASKPEASEQEPSQPEPVRLELQHATPPKQATLSEQATPPERATLPQPVTPLVSPQPVTSLIPPQPVTSLQPLQQATPPQQATPQQQATPSPQQPAAVPQLAMQPQEAAQPEEPELVAVPGPKRKPRARKRVR